MKQLSNGPFGEREDEILPQQVFGGIAIFGMLMMCTCTRGLPGFDKL